MDGPGAADRGGLPVRLAVLGAGADAERLASRLGLPMVAAPDPEAADFVLRYAGGRLGIRPTEPGGFGAVEVDLVQGRAETRRRAASRRNESVARAVGIGRGVETVVDATAGLGRDAFVLAVLGAQVTAIERSAVIAALLEDGLRRAALDPSTASIVPARLRLVVTDARTWLSALPGAGRPDAVYLDPMFPPRRKAARVKKELQLFQALLGPDDPEAGELLAVARATARRRVVVKRPVYAPPLAPGPSSTYKGRTTRFDVYLR
jgi:16S rRNA (guanine1516-N2)-methyltransferase